MLVSPMLMNQMWLIEKPIQWILMKNECILIYYGLVGQRLIVGC